MSFFGGFYVGAARLLTKIADGSAKNYLKTLVLKAVLETNISGFTKDTIKVLEPQEIFLGTQYKALGQEMAENGVIFLSGQKEGKFAESYAAVYKGEVIEEFAKAEMPNFYRKWKNVKKDNLGDTLEELSQTLRYENGRMGYVDGLFDSIDVNYKPKGFDFTDTSMSDFGIGYQTTVKYENFSGHFRRHFVNKTKTFIFDHAFPQKLPTWIDDVKVPLVQGKGIPTQAYITLRQMKLIGIAEGEIQMVKMSQIQNLDTAAFIHNATGGKIIRNFDSIDILSAPSNEYMKTVMTQAGYETISGRITGKGIYQTVKQLKTRNFPINPKFEGSYEAFMKEHGLSLDSKLYIDYNIEVKVKFIK